MKIDEMKNRISMALKDPILQQGFECICKENAKLKETVIKIKKQIDKAKDIIKDYMIIVEGDHTTVCSVPEENRCINVLKLNEKAEQFLNSEVEK